MLTVSDRPAIAGRRRAVPADTPLPWPLLALPVVLTLATGFIGARSRQLWLDEYATWWAATLDRRDFGTLIGHLDTVQAPYYLLMHEWIRLFGDSPLSLRVPSVLAMAAATWFVVRIATRVYQPAVGLLAGCLMSAVPFMGLYAQTARPYAFAVMFASGATLVLVMMLDGARRGWWAAYALALLGAGAVHLVALMVLLPHGLAVLWSVRREGGRRGLVAGWAVASAATLLALLPVVIRGYQQQGQIGGGARGFDEALFLVVYAFRNDLAAAAVVWFAVLGACLVPAARSRVIALVAWAAFPYALVIPAMDVLNLASLRYLLFALPPWFVLAAAALWRTATAWPPGIARRAGVAVLVGVFALMVPGNVELRQDPLLGYPDYRAASAAFAGAKSTDGLVIAGDNDAILHPHMPAYYLRPRGIELRGAFLAQDPREAGNYDGARCEDLRGCLLRFDRVWLMTTARSDDPFAEMDAAEARLLRDEFSVARMEEYEGVRVLLLVRPAPAAGPPAT
ncbi:glycosyltransferase family 39 protein [Dactylosporangium sp. NPDC005572]|uniref:glycosyltransferase family 39 protein n=1 Tax=Dactylosporangium sp. NPDC005572 TaxID=3156889 RepID=UPI0033B3C79F